MITLPKATYIVIDPCYVMRDDAYDVLCDKMDFNTRAQIIEIEGHQMALSNTAWGDGTYDSNSSTSFSVDAGIIRALSNTAWGDGTYDSNSSTSFSVDAGIIGAVPLALCCPEKLNEEFVKGTSVILTDTSVEFSYNEGTFKINSLEIYTGYDEEEEEDEGNIW